MRPLPLAAVLAILAACGEAPVPAPPPRTAPGAAAAPVGPPGAPAPGTGPARADDASADAHALDANWLDVRGTSIVGFGMLRVFPAEGAEARVAIRYREVPDGYATKGNLQLFVLPADAFAAKDRAYAGEFLTFTRTADEAPTGADGALTVEAAFDAGREERVVLVCYGPWTAPDAGRPAGDVPTFSLDVTVDGGGWEWVESEAGEMITTNWTARPEVARGRPCRDPVAGRDAWIEVRPMILYDGRLVRAAGEPPLAPTAEAAESLAGEAATLESRGRADLAADRRERAADLAAHAARADRRLVLVPELAEKFRRVPIRWR